MPRHSAWRPGRQGQGQSLKERREPPAAAQEKRISHRGPDPGLRAGRGWDCGWSQVGGHRVGSQRHPTEGLGIGSGRWAATGMELVDSADH